MMPPSSGFPKYKLVFYFIVFLIILVQVDINKNGSFKASYTGQVAKDVGIYPFIETASKNTKIYYNQSYRWAAKNVPVYYNTTVEACRPYTKKASEYSLKAFNEVTKAMGVILSYIGEKLPFISQIVDTYAPSLNDKKFWISVYNSIAEYSVVFIHYCLVGISQAVNFILLISENIVSWLQTNVFVGKLSMENLQKYASDSFSVALSLATKGLIWVQDKVSNLYG